MTAWTRDDNRGGPPQAGLYAMRLVRGGPLVAAAIVRDAHGRWRAVIDGSPAGFPATDPDDAPGVVRIWHGAQHSTQEEHDYLAAMKRWAAQHDPNHPCLHPYKSIDVGLLAPVVPGASHFRVA